MFFGVYKNRFMLKQHGISVDVFPKPLLIRRKLTGFCAEPADVYTNSVLTGFPEGQKARAEYGSKHYVIGHFISRRHRRAASKRRAHEGLHIYENRVASAGYDVFVETIGSFQSVKQAKQHACARIKLFRFVIIITIGVSRDFYPSVCLPVQHFQKSEIAAAFIEMLKQGKP